jgi:hypothetical protein
MELQEPTLSIHNENASDEVAITNLRCLQEETDTSRKRICYWVVIIRSALQKNYHFDRTEDSLPCSQYFDTGPSLEPDDSIFD